MRDDASAAEYTGGAITTLRRALRHETVYGQASAALEGRVMDSSAATSSLTSLEPYRARVDLMIARCEALHNDRPEDSAWQNASSMLAVPYSLLLPAQVEGMVARFEQVRVSFGLSDLACDVLWMLLAPEVWPHLQTRFKALFWPQSDRCLLNIKQLRELVDPDGQRMTAFFRATAPRGTLRASHVSG